MKGLIKTIITGLLFGAGSSAIAQQNQEINYLDMKPPGKTPVIFAPGIISTDSVEHSAPTFAPDGNTLVWTIITRGKPSFMMEMRRINGQWSTPTAAPFDDPTTDDFYPSFSSDGKKLYFSSRRPWPFKSPVRRDMSIWVVEKTSNGWTTPTPFDTVVTTGREYAHSIAGNGNVYFSYRGEGDRGFDIHQSKKLATGGYATPQPLPYLVNMNSYDDGPFISPGDDYLIFESDRAGGYGSNDLYICFKNAKGEWSQPINMGPEVNSEKSERFAKVSPDGKYLFFGRGFGTKSDIYWINASFIKELRKKNPPLINVELGNKVLAALHEGNKEKSISLLRDVHAANPTNTGVTSDLAALLIANAEFKSADETLQKLPAPTTDVSILQKKVIVAYALGRTSEAEKWAGLYEQNSPDKWSANIFLGNTLLGAKLFPGAINLYKKALALQPRGLEYYNLACAYALNKDPDHAFEALNLAKDHDYTAKGNYEHDPDLESLRSDPRWPSLIEKIDALLYVPGAAMPHKRAHHSLIYDPSSDEIIMTTGSTPVRGGQDGVFFNDTWNYDSKGWHNDGRMGDERSGIRMAYNTRDKKIYSFGGFNGESMGDLRVLDGHEWKTIVNIPEMKAAEPGFVYDIHRDVFIAFGGSFGRGLARDITWEWNGTSWKKFEGDGPEGRTAFVMEYDSKRNKTVVFGGGGGQQTFGDTWEFDGKQWKKVADHGPSPRVAAGSAFDSKRGMLILFGGMSDGKFLNDTWGWDGIEWKKLSASGPPRRVMGYMTYDSKRDRVVLFGGRLGWPNDANDTWEWDGEKWVMINAGE